MTKPSLEFPKRIPRTFPFRAARGHAAVAMYRSKNKGYDEFRIPFNGPNGQRSFHRFSNYDAARDKGSEILRQLLKGDVSAITLTANDKLVYVRAVELLRPHKLDLDQAVRQFVDARKALEGVPASLAVVAAYYAKRHPAKMPEKTVTEVVDEFIEMKRANGLSKLYIEDLNYRLGRFKNAFHVNIAHVEGDQLRAFLDGLKLSPRSYNNFRLALVTLFEFAKKRKYLPADWNEFDGIDKMKDGGGAIEIFTPEEMAALLSHASIQLVPFLAIGGFAGLRSAEIERLDWQDVKFSTGSIVVGKDKAKTATRRVVPISDNLKAWLHPYSRTRGKVWTHSKPYLYESLAALATTAKVPWKQNALRHSYISYRVAESGDVNRTALEAGNSAAMIFSNYRELVTPKDAKQWFSIIPSEQGKVINLRARADLLKDLKPVNV